MQGLLCHRVFHNPPSEWECHDPSSLENGPSRVEEWWVSPHLLRGRSGVWPMLIFTVWVCHLKHFSWLRSQSL